MKSQIDHRYFAYLSKSELKNINKTITNNTFSVTGDIENLQQDIQKMFLQSTTAKELHLDNRSLTWTHKNIKTQIEVAHLALLTYKLIPYKKPFKPNRNHALLSGHLDVDKVIAPSKFLRIFFGFKTFAQWSYLMDQLLACAFEKLFIFDIIDANDLFICKALLTKLPVIMRDFQKG
ncbi:hypothetical protein [Sphingobacterium sp. SYP-B4668]|uniref:hypothetical protein n=1 Tax=Sphingobacterium sp. SYP-B4668 TaxID=2996035 RepID=UPI0022DD53BB|nr:hypothetical protein [Sphingobacterium sp. SYP-B4668]